MKKGSSIKFSTTPYVVTQHKLFKKESSKLSTAHRKRIKKLILTLIDKPTELPPNTISLSGYTSVFRTRLGDYRIIYSIHHADRAVILLGVGSRGSVYQLIDRLLK
jgi:mRNA interferase RelE/StbE